MQENQCGMANLIFMSDLLTGLHSRHQLHIEMLSLAARANAARPLALLLLEVRDFDLWQRQLTPLAGDKLIQAVGEILNRAAPDGAYLARWNNACFAMLLPECPLWCAEDVGEALRVEAQQAALPSIFAYHGLGLDLVYGAACLPPSDTANLTLAAEEQLDRAKGGPLSRLLVRPDGVHLQEGAAEAYVRLAESYLIHGDPYLKRHGRMTSGYAQQVGRRLGFSAEQLEELAIAAAFSDIAMKEAAGACLEKPGCLTYGEFRRVARHPVFSAELCRALGLPEGVRETVLCHHESWDGSGYPEGRKGEEIPLSAAILSACGAFAAMLLPRPYRPARKLYAARAILSQGAGRKWPAPVVREVIGL